MTPVAHRVAPCPGCATCQPRRDRLLAFAIIAVFVIVFVVPTVLGWHR